MIGRTNLKSGGGEELNVFAQLAEPSKKDGIWVKTEKTTNENINFVNMTTIPKGSSQNISAVVGTDIYFFSFIDGTSNSQFAYKYNTLADSYTLLQTPPTRLDRDFAIAINNKIYLSNGQSGRIDLYVYDISTNSYSTVTSIAGIQGGGYGIGIGTDIYVFGSSNNSYNTKAVKYDTLTNTTTQLADIPTSLRAYYSNCIAYYEGYIYLFISGNSYKYNIETDTYATISSLNKSFNSAVIYDNKIYLLGVGSNTTDNHYVYNIETDTYTQLLDISPAFYYGSAQIVDNNIFLIGGDISRTTMRKQVIIIYPAINKFNYDLADLRSDLGISDFSNVNNFVETETAKTSYPYKTRVTIGTDIYLFGGNNSSYYTRADKYDTLTNTMISLTSIPNSQHTYMATTFGTDIYLFQTFYYSNVYKYDTLTNSYTKMNNKPGSAICFVATVGDYIYLFEQSYVYKYDPLTDTYTKLISTPTSSSGYSEVVGTDIYLFISSGYAYKYNTLTDTYTQLASFPSSYPTTTVFETDIYLISGTGSNLEMYKYDTLTDTYKSLKKLTISNLPGSSDLVMSFVNGTIYIFYLKYNFIVYLYIKNNNVVIFTKNRTHKVKLVDKLEEIGFEYAYICKDLELPDYPCYYGNGTQWNLIEN